MCWGQTALSLPFFVTAWSLRGEGVHPGGFPVPLDVCVGGWMHGEPTLAAPPSSTGLGRALACHPGAAADSP